MEKINSKEWACVSSNDGKSIRCESKRGDMLTAFDDGSVRYSKKTCDLKVDGKSIPELKDSCGAELS